MSVVTPFQVGYVPFFTFEAEICKRRGHSPSNVIRRTIEGMNVCKWCGANYRDTSPPPTNTPENHHD